MLTSTVSPSQFFPRKLEANFGLMGTRRVRRGAHFHGACVAANKFQERSLSMGL